MSEYNVAYGVVDEPLLSDVHVTSDIEYIRWHERGQRPWYDYRYTKDQLTDWLPKIEEVRANTTQTFRIFNSHFRGYAPENCIHTHIDGKSTPSTEERTTLDRFTQL